MKKNNKNIQFKIYITEQYTLQCHFININNAQNNNMIDDIEKSIQLKENRKEEYPFLISFNDNQIQICNEEYNQNTIEFIKDLLEEPTNYKLYKIHFQEKEYDVIAEVLFALIINEFKQQIEKYKIIIDTSIEIKPNHNQFALERIKIALQAIQCNGIEIVEEEIQFNYKEQGNILH